MNKVITFGEIMIRLSPPDHKRIFQTDSFEVAYGGAEANVAAVLAQLGCDSYFVTALPDNSLGKAAESHLKHFGVGTDYITKKENGRLGVYFLEKGVSQRPSNVIYDRKYSAISLSEKEDFNWKEIFNNADWFHFTGITPALSDNVAEITYEAAKKAKEKGLKVSCDLNYRGKLWSQEKAKEVMTPLMEFVDVVIGNEEDAEKIFGIRATDSSVEKGELRKEDYEIMTQKLVSEFDLDLAAITLRESYSASVNGWSAIIHNGERMFESKKYEIHVVDRVGGGDSFAGGLIFSQIINKSLQDTLEFAVACSTLKHTIHGDFNVITPDEVENLIKSSGSGRIQR
jgi:2-dehydro-3-deoxygluconokinase